MAEARGVADRFAFDSAGIEGYHVGEPPDRRARARARLRGYDLSNLRARRVAASDFEEFDLILAMDRSHFDRLETLCPPPLRHKLKLFLSYAGSGDDLDVPDPYYGEISDFDHVLDLCEEAGKGML